MRIFVQSATGIHNVEASEETSISSLKCMTGASSLQWGGRILREELTVGDYGIMEESTLEALEALLGGKKKRKKKVHTTPKKKKHVKKKVKLATLNIYKVDKSEKVNRTKRVCDKCGPGTFMAKHFDRHYCGKCHLTVMFAQAA